MEWFFDEPPSDLDDFFNFDQNIGDFDLDMFSQATPSAAQPEQQMPTVHFTDVMAPYSAFNQPAQQPQPQFTGQSNGIRLGGQHARSAPVSSDHVTTRSIGTGMSNLNMDSQPPRPMIEQQEDTFNTMFHFGGIYGTGPESGPNNNIDTRYDSASAPVSTLDEASGSVGAPQYQTRWQSPETRFGSSVGLQHQGYQNYQPAYSAPPLASQLSYQQVDQERSYGLRYTSSFPNGSDQPSYQAPCWR